MGSRSRKKKDTASAPRRGEGVPGDPQAHAEDRRLELLFRVSTLLTRFESVKRDVAAVLTLVGEVLPLRTAVLVLGDPGAPLLTTLWRAEGTSAARQQEAIAHVRRAYAHLAGEVPVAEPEAGAGVLRTVSGTEDGAARFVLLPLVVAGGPIFGALQVEGAAPLDESDLTFVNTVVNQLALAIDRNRAIDARRVEAERGRAQAEALQRRYETLVDNLDHAFVWEARAPDRRLEYVSARARQLLEHREWRGHDFVERVHDEDKRAVERTLAEILEAREDRSVEHRMVAGDGSVRWFHTGVHLAGTDGQARWQGVSVDVTAAHEATVRLAEQLEFTRALSASLGEGVLAVDRELRVTFVNPVAEAMLGIGQQACDGPLQEVLQITRADGTRLEGRRSPLARVIRTGKRLRSDAQLFARPGAAPFPVSYTSAPLRRNGDVTGAVLVFRDLLEVRRAEREQRFLADTSELLSGSLEVRTTLSQLVRAAVPLLADVGMVDEIDEEGRVSRIDVAFADPAKRRFGPRARRFAPSIDAPTPQGQALRTGKAVLLPEVSARAIAQDEDHARWLEDMGIRSMMVVPLIARGRTLGALTFGAAESGRRYAARELVFAEEVGRRAALAVDNARLYEQARRATEARQELLAIVSHDLRNPLSSVVMATQVLLEAPLPPAEVRVAIERIRRAVQSASRLVEDLLDIGSIESGQFALATSTQALGPILEEAIELSRGAAEDAGLRLELEPLPRAIEVPCDRERILQVLGNLIGNAIKFTPAGGRIVVRGEPHGPEVMVSVSDTGAGISPEAIAHVFDRYWQVKRERRAGAGLGLAIVQGLVRAHGGTLWVESTVGEGSTFCFTLPLATPP